MERRIQIQTVYCRHCGFGCCYRCRSCCSWSHCPHWNIADMLNCCLHETSFFADVFFDCLDFGTLVFEVSIHFVDFYGASVLLLLALDHHLVGMSGEEWLVHFCCTQFDDLQADVFVKSDNEELKTQE